MDESYLLIANRAPCPVWLYLRILRNGSLLEVLVNTPNQRTQNLLNFEQPNRLSNHPFEALSIWINKIHRWKFRHVQLTDYTPNIYSDNRYQRSDFRQSLKQSLHLNRPSSPRLKLNGSYGSIQRPRVGYSIMFYLLYNF